jgi:hypothetical protein
MAGKFDLLGMVTAAKSARVCNKKEDRRASAYADNAPKGIRLIADPYGESLSREPTDIRNMFVSNRSAGQYQ